MRDAELSTVPKEGGGGDIEVSQGIGYQKSN